jgi:hypothetical protein
VGGRGVVGEEAGLVAHVDAVEHLLALLHELLVAVLEVAGRLAALLLLLQLVVLPQFRVRHY